MYAATRSVKDEAANWDAVVRIIAATPTLVAAFHRVRTGQEILDPRDDLDHAANFYYMMIGTEPTPAVRKVLDAALIVHAEHTMNASTFSARVTGSTLANPYAVISSAIGTLSGPLHGGANEEALAQFEEIGGADKVQGWLDGHLAADPKFKIMGMGHRVYKVKDPRANVVQELAENVFAESSAGRRPTTPPRSWKRSPRASTGRRASTRTSTSTAASSTTPSASRPTSSRRSSPSPGPPAGWPTGSNNCDGNRIFRPDQVFVGTTDVEYVPLEKRA